MTFRTCWLLALFASCGVMPPGPTDGGGRNLLTGGGGVSFGTGGGSTGGGFAAAGGSTAGGSTAGGSTAGGSTAGGSTAGGSSAGGQSAGGQAGGSSINATNLVAGQAVRVNSTGATGNPQRNYRIVVPSGKTEIVLSLSGGTCSPHTCIGGDVELYLKRGALPDAFSPDGTTTRWTFTPGGTGRYSKPAVAGDTWYLGIIDGANTLGYRDVDLTIYPAGPTCDGSGTPCTTASQCCTNQCIPTGPSTKICG